MGILVGQNAGALEGMGVGTAVVGRLVGTAVLGRLVGTAVLEVITTLS